MIGDASVVPRNEVGMTVEPWDEEKILSMFADQTWDFWSVPALMKATGFPEPKIKTVLNRRADEIRQSPAVDRHGHALGAVGGESLAQQGLVGEGRGAEDHARDPRPQRILDGF